MQIPQSEISHAVEILTAATEEGCTRCAEPLKWLLNDHYIAALQARRLAHSKGVEAYFLLTFEIFNELQDKIYIEDMKASLLLADDEWELKSTDLGKTLKNCISDSKQYISYCLEILKTSANEQLKRSALIGILEEKNKNPLADGLNQSELCILKRLSNGSISD